MNKMPSAEVDANPRRPFSELTGESGMLWAINRVLLHPRGYAMAIHIDDNGDATGWSLLGDGSEPWAFRNAADEDASFAGFEKTLRATSA